MIQKTLNINSNNSFENIYDLILSKDFGKVNLTEGFIENLHILSPSERIIKILNHFIQLEPVRLTYSEIPNLLLNHIDMRGSEFYNRLNDPLNEYSNIDIMDDLLTRCTDFSMAYFFSLLDHLSISLYHFYKSYSLKHYKALIDENVSLISQSNELFTLAPLIYGWEVWKDLVKYEFSILNSKALVEINREKWISLLKQLQYRLEYDKIPNFSQCYMDVSSMRVDGEELYFSDQFYVSECFNMKNYRTPINKYVSFIQNLKIDESVFDHKDSLIYNLDREKRKKVTLSKSPFKLYKLFQEFFVRNNVELDENKDERVKSFINSCFKYDTKHSFHSTTNETINFLNFSLREKFCTLIHVLNKEGVIEYRSSRHLYQILIDELKTKNKENIGLSESTLKPLFSDLNKKNNLVYEIVKQSGFNSLSEVRALIQ